MLELIDLWWREAECYGVLPLDDFVNEPLEVGRDGQTPVDDVYGSPFACSGRIKDVTIEVVGREVVAPELLLETLTGTL